MSLDHCPHGWSPWIRCEECDKIALADAYEEGRASMFKEFEALAKRSEKKVEFHGTADDPKLVIKDE